MSQPIHTPGPVHLHQYTSQGDKLVSIDAKHRHITLHTLELPEDHDNARLLAAAYNAFDSAGKRLALNAVELAERMQNGGVADLIEALMVLLGQVETEALLFPEVIPQYSAIGIARAALVKVKGEEA
jgi:hypothetical protein